MPNAVEKLLMTDEEIKRDIIADFASEFLNEVRKLVEREGKNSITIYNKSQRGD